MLSARISSWSVCSVYTSVPDALSQCTHQFLTHMLRIHTQNEHLKNRKNDIHADRAHIRNWCILSGCASVPAVHAKHAQQFLTCTFSVHIKVGACAKGIQFLQYFLKYLKQWKFKKKSLLTLTNGLKSFTKKSSSFSSPIIVIFIFVKPHHLINPGVKVTWFFHACFHYFRFVAYFGHIRDMVELFALHGLSVSD